MVTPRGGKVEQEVPQLASGDGVNAGGGFVQEEEFGLVDQRAGQGQALLPSAREGPGELSAIRADLRKVHDFAGANGKAPAVQSVDSPVEIQVLGHRQVAVKAELLGHVPDPPFDLFALGGDGLAQDDGVSGGGGQHAAEHADNGALAAAVGAQEPEDRSLANLETGLVDRCQRPEPADELPGINDGRRDHRLSCWPSHTSAPHPRPQHVEPFVQVDLHAEDLLGPFLGRLDVGRRELDLPGDESDVAP